MKPSASDTRWLELMEVLTVGLPFCGFKVLAGLSFSGVGGAPLVALGAIDAVINTVNVLGLLFARRRLLPACAFSVAARLLPSRRPAPSREDLGNALDVLFSFSLVALMIGGDRLRLLQPRHLSGWNVCVIINVLGAGLGWLGQSLRGA